MTDRYGPPSAEELNALVRVARSVARTRLRADDAQDFVQAVQLRVIERRYDIFRQFAGRSSLETFLRVVVTRLLLDWMNSEYGKWRPSAAARSLGPIACRLDRGINRDGFTVDQAVSALAVGSNLCERTLAAVAQRLPRRPRRHFVPALELDAAMSQPFEDPIESFVRERDKARAVRALRRAVRRLPQGERELILMRYAEHRSVPQIAGHAGLEPKALYRRFERLLRILKTDLADAGVTGSAISG